MNSLHFDDRNSRRPNSQAVDKKISLRVEFLADLYHPRAAIGKARFLSLEECYKEPPEPLVPSSFGGIPCNTARA
jgi:hypothetical protein